MLTAHDAHDAITMKVCSLWLAAVENMPPNFHRYTDTRVKNTEFHNQAMDNQTTHNRSCTTSFRLCAREGGHGRGELPAGLWEKMDMWLAEHFMPKMLMTHDAHSLGIQHQGRQRDTTRDK